ncbi:hypothetical protein [Paludibaculum fermentans]|uniref:hypothetical protein n=1 Tax=Paludibaculum fermentans TaxID=1473598 RepID=UPI003EBD2981
MSTPATPSARRLAANRANARKSTGPRSEAGKRASSQNARKTPPCPFTLQLPAKFEAEWFHDALRRTAACSDGRARLLLLHRCMLQAHEIRWSALERSLFDVAFDESKGCVEDASLWLAQQVAAAKGLVTYRRWIAHRINQVERSLAALATQSAGVEAEAPKTMAAGAGGGSALCGMTPSDPGPESTLPISLSDSGWSFAGLSGLFTQRAGVPQPPQPPRPPKPPTISPIRGRYRLYLRCPAAPELPNEANAPTPPTATGAYKRGQFHSSSTLGSLDAHPHLSLRPSGHPKPQPAAVPLRNSAERSQTDTRIESDAGDGPASVSPVRSPGGTGQPRQNEPNREANPALSACRSRAPPEDAVEH